MEKYIGNKKSIVEGIDGFLNRKGINNGVIIDAFSGTTNVGQYFKQRGYSIVSNDINEFSYVLGKAYIENNIFPQFTMVRELIKNSGFYYNDEQILDATKACCRKIKNDKVYAADYVDRVGYIDNILPLIQVLQYLNSLETTNINEEELLFYDYYTEEGRYSEYISSRGTRGRRNYFEPENAKRLGVIMNKLRTWKREGLIEEMEFYILLTSVIEEVTLNANVNGTFHDFNRKKLYPNASQKFELKAPILNIYQGEGLEYHVFNEDSNRLHENLDFMRILGNQAILYIDPPYNFRQYSAYYHLLNFLAKYHEIDDVLEYAKDFRYVRGQNMADNFNSDYCYKDKFAEAMEDLIIGIPSHCVVISYYDENNHWNHGETEISMEGRKAIVGIFEKHGALFEYDTEPYMIPRTNYQSQSGGHKKQIDELVFFARRRINVD